MKELELLEQEAYQGVDQDAVAYYLETGKEATLVELEEYKLSLKYIDEIKNNLQVQSETIN